jgi:hypothetical protein
VTFAKTGEDSLAGVGAALPLAASAEGVCGMFSLIVAGTGIGESGVDTAFAATGMAFGDVVGAVLFGLAAPSECGSADFGALLAAAFFGVTVGSPVASALRGAGTSAPVAFDKKLLNVMDLGAALAMASGAAALGAVKSSWIRFAAILPALICHCSQSMWITTVLSRRAIWAHDMEAVETQA